MTSIEIKKLEMSLFDEGIEDFTGWEEGAYWVRVMRKITNTINTSTEYLSGRTFIDLGCGKSLYIPIARANGLVPIALDISIEFLALNENCHKVLADGENLPFRDSSIDYTCVIGMIHHLPNKELGISEVQRITRGLFYINEPYSRSLNWVYWFIRRCLIALIGQDRMMKLLGFGTPHESFVSKAQLRDGLKDKFNLDVVYYSPFREPPLKFIRERCDFGRLNDFLERLPLIRSLGTYISVKGESHDFDY